MSLPKKRCIESIKKTPVSKKDSDFWLYKFHMSFPGFRSETCMINREFQRIS